MSKRRIFAIGLVTACFVALVASQRVSESRSSLAVDLPPGGAPPALSPVGAGDSGRPAGRGGEETKSEYLRFVAGKDPGEGELQTSIVTMVGDGGVQVDLISVVHVADGAYYRKLQKCFKTYDSLLYEMVKDEDVKPVPSEGGGGLLTFFQRTLKNLLDLEFQLDAIDYTTRNFVHADLDPDTFFRLQKERGESLLSLMFKVLRADLLARQKGDKAPQLGLVQLVLALSSDDSARALKFLLAQQMENMEAIIAGIEDSSSGEGSVIVVERNKKALSVLRKRLNAGEKKVGIFYGGAHMPDMEARLISEFKLRRSRSKWLTAWSIRKKTQAKPADWFQRFLKPGGSEPQNAGSPRDRRSSGRGEL